MKKPEASEILDQMKKAYEAHEQMQRTQDAIEAVLVYFMHQYGKDVGNERKEFILTKAMMDDFDPKALRGFGLYFEHNHDSKTCDLRCVSAPKQQLLEEATLAEQEPKGSA